MRADRTARPPVRSRFDTLENRIEHGDALVDLLVELFGARDLPSWREAFDGWDAPWEVCPTIRDLIRDPQALANDYMSKVRVEDGTEVTLVKGPVSVNGSPLPARPACAPGSVNTPTRFWRRSPAAKSRRGTQAARYPGVTGA